MTNVPASTRPSPGQTGLDEASAWAHSGAMWLSGPTDGAPLLPPGSPTLYVDQQLSLLSFSTEARTGSGVVGLPDHRLLGERAAVAGHVRAGTQSPGGAFRTLATPDGWFGLSLARPDDITLIPALIEGTVDIDDPWPALAGWAASTPAAEAIERARLLGLPASAWPPAPSQRPATLLTGGAAARIHSGSGRERPLIIDLSSLWAGPLAAHLLSLAGCQVVKVESSRRLDGARRGPADFYDLLHAGHDSVTVDFTTVTGRTQLADLLTRADLVIEGSRPRALAALGITPEPYLAAGISWLSITAHGRASEAVGFGDDVAVDAGLAIVTETGLMTLGDAIADPLTGVTAAAQAAAALAGDRAQLIDISMRDVVRATLGPAPTAAVSQRDGNWWVESSSGLTEVAAPGRRTPKGRAATAGAHNERWLA